MNYHLVKDLKKDLEELWDFYSTSSSKNKSFERINKLRLEVDTYSWAIDKPIPDDIDNDYLNFWIVNNYVCRYILSNTDISKLKYIKPLKKSSLEERQRINHLIDKIIQDWGELIKIYPIVEISLDSHLSVVINKICETSISEIWKK